MIMEINKRSIQVAFFLLVAATLFGQAEMADAAYAVDVRETATVSSEIDYSESVNRTNNKATKRNVSKQNKIINVGRELSVYMSKNTTQVKLMYEAPQDGKVEVNIHNQEGKKIRTEVENAKQGTNKAYISVEGLEVGSYTIKINAGTSQPQFRRLLIRE